MDAHILSHVIGHFLWHFLFFTLTGHGQLLVALHHKLHVDEAQGYLVRVVG